VTDPQPFEGAMLYATSRLSAPRSVLNPGGTAGPFAVVYLAGGIETTTHDPADFEAIAAEFTRAAGMLRDALAGRESKEN